MKQRILIQGLVTELYFPNNGKVVPTETQPPISEADSVTGDIEWKAASPEHEAFHVKGVLPGQTILASLGKRGKRGREGRLLRVVEPAPYEVESNCPHAAECGGCQFQTMPYEKQLEWKAAQVKALLSDVPTIETAEWRPIVGSPLQADYRNKMEFSFGDAEKGGALTLGLHKKNAYHDIIETDGCRLVHADLRLILKATADFFRAAGATYYNTYSHRGYLRHLVLRRSFTNGGVLVNLVTSSEEGPSLEPWVEAVKALPLEGFVAGILHTANDAESDIVRNDSFEVLYGESYLTESLLGLSFKISPFSFFQTNSLGAEELYRTVREAAGDVSGQCVLDLYCGTGTIAQVMAAAGAKEVYGIELVEEAAEAARVNAKLNQLPNCSFYAGDVLKLVETLPQADTIILDPPRDGCHPKALPKILAFRPNRFVYVSCKITSLVRDLPAFVEAGYRIDSVQPVDMFPMTPGVETVVCLTKK